MAAEQPPAPASRCVVDGPLCIFTGSQKHGACSDVAGKNLEATTSADTASVASAAVWSARSSEVAVTASVLM